MMPPGRRRGMATSPFVQIFALFFLFTATARAAVLGLDFGTLHIKAALVKPGVPLDIVLTKDSKRKEIAALAYKPVRDEKNNIIAKVGTYPERAYGGDALALQGRFPGEVFPNLKTLLGLQLGDESSRAIQIYESKYPAVQALQVAGLGTTAFKSGAFVDVEKPFTVEELVGMQLASIRRNAEAMAGPGSLVEDAVITVPAFYTADEKRAIVRAAGYAGLTVTSLITDGLAVGLEYAKSRTFPDVTKGEAPEYHLVYDMGAGSTTATVMRFQSRSVKDVGRFNKTVQEVGVLGTGWDRTLGGDSLNQVIINDYIEKLMTKPVLKSRGTQRDEVIKNGRAMSRIYKDAEKARQVLSANTETTSSFEEILPDVDFKVKISRAEFEHLTTDFADRVEGPIKSALEMAKLTIDDIKTVILHGGAVRTPFVQRKLEAIVGDTSKLRSNVNADEAAVFGAAFKAAAISPSFKVKEIRDSDIAVYPLTLIYTDKGKERHNQLFVASSPTGAGAVTKQVTFKDKDDFSFRFVQTIDESDFDVVKITTENLTASVQELVSKYGCEKDAINTKMSVRLNAAFGLPEIVSGTVSCEVDDVKSGSVGDTVKDWLGFGKKKDQVPLGDGEADEPVEEVDATASSATVTSKETSSKGKSETSSAATSSKSSEPPKKKIESINIKLLIEANGTPQPSADDLERIFNRLKEFDVSDRTRVLRDEAQNVLESYTYFARDLLSNIDYEKFSSQAQRDAVSKILDTTREWMDASGEVASATREVLKAKLDDLKELVEPIVTRRKESSTRPDKLTGLKKSLDETGKLLLNLESQIQAALEAQSRAEEWKASSSTSTDDAEASTATPSSATEGLDDLEEPDTTTAADLPKYSDPTDFNAYANLDISDIRDKYDSINAWLVEKEAAQAELGLTDDPVLLTRDIESKAKVLAKAMENLVYRQMKAARPMPTATKAKSKATKSPKKTKSKATSTSEDPAVETAKSQVEDVLDDIKETLSSQTTSSSKSTSAAKNRDEL